MESVSFTFNGVDTLVATIHNAVPTRTYQLFPFAVTSYTPAIDTAVSTTLILTINDIVMNLIRPTFEADVVDNVTNEYLGSTIFSTDGSTREFTQGATWSYDGSLTVEITTEVDDYGGNWTLYEDGEAGNENNSPGEAWASSPQTFSIVLGTPPTGRFVVALTRQSLYAPYSIRLFDAGEASSGFPGNPSSLTQYLRIYGWRVNISDDALETVDPLMVSPETGSA